MNTINKIVKAALFVTVFFVVAAGCKKTTQPALGDYAKDQDPRFPLYPGGPLKFYAAFDGSGTDVLRNAVDSIRANFPADNPLTSTAGISGKGIQGSQTKYIKYAGANDFISRAESFSIAFWEKRNGTPAGNAQFVFTFPSSNKKWGNYGFANFLLFDWGTPNDSAIVKYYMVDKAGNDHWFEWTGANRVKGIQDNNWHHLVLAYDATTSALKLYVDGVAHSNIAVWASHGAANMDNSMISEFDMGGNANIPKMGWGANWDGALDQFRLYGTALTATEVGALFANKK